MMRRKIAIVLLGLGTLGGYAAGVASLACHARHHAYARGERFMGRSGPRCDSDGREGGGWGGPPRGLDPRAISPHGAQP